MRKTKTEKRQKIEKIKKNKSKKEKVDYFFGSKNSQKRKLNKKVAVQKEKASIKPKPYYLGTLWEMDAKEVYDDFIEREIGNHKELGKTYSRINSFLKFKKIAAKRAKRAGIFTFKSSYRFAIMCVVAVFIYQFFPGALCAPQSKGITTKAEWDLGQFEGTTSENSVDSIQMKPAGSWQARTWTPPEDIIGYGHTSAIVGDYIYVFRGFSGNAFWRYDTENNTWSNLAELPQPAYYGADMTYIEGSGKIYATFGGYSKKFYSYDIENNAWTRLADLLDTPWTGSVIENDGTDIYATRGGNTTDFWFYDVSENLWSSRTGASLAVSQGADLVNGHDGYLYLLRGNGSRNLYRYSISGKTWSVRSDTPATGCSSTTCTFGTSNTGEQKGTYRDGYIYFMRSQGNTDFLRFNVSGNSWEILSSDQTPQANNFGSLVYNEEDDLIYAFRSNSTTDLWKFDPDATVGQKWVGPKQVQDAAGNLRAVGTGGNLIWNRQSGASSALYAFIGIGTTNYYKFDIANNSWLSAGSTPGFTFNNDIKGTSKSNGAIYMLRTGTTGPIVNIMIGGTWSAMSPQPTPNSAGDGAGLTFVNNDLYYLRGGANACMYKYTDGGSWGSCIPTAVKNVGIGTTVTYYPNVGARIISNNTDLYMMPGDGETAFLKYTVSSGNWSNLSSTPFSQYYGTDMTYNSTNSKIYALAGIYKDETWEFDTTNEAAGWRRIPDNQKFTFDRGPYNGASIEFAGGSSLYAIPGQGVTLPSGSADMWSFTVPATNYITSGTSSYTSHMIDLGQVSEGTTFSFSETKPSNTDVVYEMCSNADGSTCSSWHTVTNGDISDHDSFELERYVWVRITLSTTDGASTPIVSDYTIAYASSDAIPAVPNSLIAKSQQTGGTDLTNDTEYKFEHPYFTWSAGTDNGSGIAGYYVYFGKESDADPAADGIYQAGSTYSVNEAMTYDTDPVHNYGTYYLIIKAKDNNGLVSDPWSAFTYKYAAVSPPQIVSKTTQSDFNKIGADFDSGNVSYSAVDGSLRLNNTSGFWNQKRLSASPYYTYVGSEMALGGCKTTGANSLNGNHCLYTFQGNGTLVNMRYEIETDTWINSTATPTELAPSLLSISNNGGGSMVEGPEGYIYASRGNISGANTTFWVYDIANKQWTELEGAPKSFEYGSVMVYDESRYIYTLTGNDDAFYAYDTCNGESECTPGWIQLANANFGNPNTLDGQRTNEGADGTYDGRNNIYVSQGNLYPYFAKYSIADDPSHGETANTWTVLPAAPVSFYYGGSVSFDGDHSIYALAGNTRMKFMKYDMDTDTWSILADAPATISYGASIIHYGDYLYVTRGGASTTFYRYDITENTWDTPNRDFFGSHNVDGSVYFPYSNGARITQDGNENIYIIRGGYDNTFGRYNIQTGTFTKLTNLPVGTYNGASIVYNSYDSSVYYVPGDIRTRRTVGDTKSPYFFKYSIAANSWTEISADRPLGQVYNGSSMTSDGTNIYLTQGNGSATWWKYDPTAEEDSRWSSMSTTSSCLSYYGSTILYKDGTIYRTQGNGSTTNCKYSGGTWTSMGNFPAGGIGYGSTLIDGEDGYIYATRGNNSNAYYRYDVSQSGAGSWTDLSSTYPVPAQITTGGSGVNLSARNWTTSGAGGGTTYADGLYSYVIGSSTNGTGFVKTGTYTSETIDLTQVYKFANLSVGYTTPINTSLEIQTRTSSNGSVWTSWSTVSDDHASGTDHVFSINSNPNRYIQIRMLFSSSDQVYSPTIESYSINYYQDTVQPTGPQAAIAYRGVGNTATITNPSGDSWFNLTAPHFEWPAEGEANGASDGSGGSGISGYYVCFGTSDDCTDAYSDGTFQAENSFTASALASSSTDYSNSGKTYYLRVAAVDNAGWPSTSFTGFVYNFDNSPPTNPSTLTVSPTGYSSNSFFTMSWTDDASDDHSDVNKLQYCTDCDPTDPLELPGISWTDIGDGLLSLDVAPYQGNENTFYLRVLDGAGNGSTPMPKFFYYSGGAASPPTDLIADPSDEDNAYNSFTFTWNTPASYGGDPTKIKYYYSINVLPTAYNTIETTAKSAGPGPFATQYGENKFYVVAMNEGGVKTNDGDVDWEHPAEAKFYAKTTAPGPPLNLQIFDTSDKESQEFSLALKWSTPTSYDSGNFSGYAIYRSDTEAGIYTEIATTTGTAFVDTELESRVYYYYVKSKDRTSNYSIPTSTVYLIPTGRYTRPPSIVSEPSVEVQSFAATITWSTNRVCSSFVEYGTSSSMDDTNGQVDSVTSHEVSLEGLDADTKYYYRAKFIDPDGNIGMSDVLSFTTEEPPTISDVAVTEVGLNSATVSWTTNMSGTCTLKYGKGAFSSAVEENAGGTTHIQKLSSLESATPYVYQIDCVDEDENDFNSDQYTFSTLEQSFVSDLTIQNVMDVNIPTIQVNYKTNHNSTTLIKFKGSNESSYHNYLTADQAMEHEAKIEGLDPAIEYEIIATGIDENGLEALSQTQKVTTLTDSKPPAIVTNRAVGKVVGRGKDARANLYVKIETDELSKVKVLFGKGIVLSNFEQSTAEDPDNTYHMITIPVEPGQVYSYVVSAKDSATNETITKPATVVIENAKENATEIVVSTFGSKFGWVSKLWTK